MSTAARLKTEGDTLRYSTLALGPAAMILVLLSAWALFPERLGSPGLAHMLNREFPAYRIGAWALLAFGLICSLYWRKTILFHRSGDVTLIRDFSFFHTHKHYPKCDTFGLAVYEYESKDPEDHTEIYRIELILLSGKRIALIPCASLADLHDCRRVIERFTGEEVARKKITDLLRGGPR